MQSTMSRVTLLLLLLPLLVAINGAHGATLKVGFYSKTCPSAEKLVQKAVADAFANNSRVAAGLVRMFFHDCFVRGCDGSVLLDTIDPNNPAEKEGPPNNPSLHGFEVIDAAKSALEAACPNTVSCADIVAFAARDSAALAGNITWKVPAGRRDGNVSIANETLTDLPAPFFNATQLVQSFKNKNLTADEMVALSGAHSIGVAHCGTFTGRIFNFSSTNEIDPTLSSAYADLLRSKCPANSTLSTPIVAALDIISSTILDNKYYVGLKLSLGLLTSDQALLTEKDLKKEVDDYAKDGKGWAEDFAKAMVKMGKIEVLTGTQGEIRKNCHFVNGRSAADDGAVLIASS